MKRIVFFTIVLALICNVAMAQLPRGTAKASVGGETVEIEYGRPSLNGRDMLGRAQAGTVWRMGADGATIMETGTALKFGDSVVPAGSYTLRARKESGSSWTLLIDSAGSGTVAEVPLEVSQPSSAVELFTIELKGEGAKGSFSMAWGEMLAIAAFTAG